MKKIIIVTDSNSGITQDEGKKLGIYVVPMPFTVDGEEYLEDISITQDKFYEFLAKDADVKTSQPSQYSLEQIWDELLKDYEELVFIPMSSGLSGTCENAIRYAKKYNGRVLVVDNKKISVSQRNSVMQALYYASCGKTALEIKNILEENKEKHSIYIMLSTLKYLKKGGRISPLAATLGGLLKIKPILYSDGGKFDKWAVSLNTLQAKRKILDQIKYELENKFSEDYKNGNVAVGVTHTQNFAEANKFKQEIIKLYPNLKFKDVDPLSLSVSCHIGAGALAALLFIDKT